MRGCGDLGLLPLAPFWVWWLVCCLMLVCVFVWVCGWHVFVFASLGGCGLVVLVFNVMI